jgi:hypothetical protein
MKTWHALLLALVLPACTQAQDKPEALLPGTTQLYLRWDGVDAHALDYARTAMGKLLAGDTGHFITGLFEQLQESLAGSLTVDQLLQGVSPEKLKKIQADAKEAPRALTLVAGHGFILAGEVRGVNPPQAELTLIVPGAGEKSTALFAAFRLIAALADAELKESKIDGKIVHHFSHEFVHVAWWLEGKHAVLTAGSAPAEALVKRRAPADAEARLTANPLFRKVSTFKEFGTAARGFIDLPAMLKGIKLGEKELDQHVAELVASSGLDGIKSITFYSGFDGDADRGLIEIDAPGPRKGLLSLAGGKPFDLSEVPPLPADVTSWSMANFDLQKTYDVVLQLVEQGIKLFKPDALAEFQGGYKQVDEFLGVKLRDDILAHLDGRFLVYNSPAEGPFTLGQTFLMKVKDPEKLSEAMDTAVKSLLKLAGGEASVHKRKFHDAVIHEVNVRKEGFIFVPSWTIRNGWLAIGYYPQAVQGYVLRANGELPAWKASPQTQASLDRLPRQFTLVSWTDPSPSVRQILALAPLVLGVVNSSVKDIRFDVGSLPNAHEATRHLFPNVTVATDREGVIRFESRASLELPFDLSGVELYGVFFAFALARF